MNPSEQAMYQRFLSHLAADQRFLGHELASYAARHGLEDDALADWLKCDVGGLRRLKACSLPDLHSRQFAAQVKRIAEFAGCDHTQLLSILREGQVVQSLRNSLSPGTTTLAARDRQDTEDHTTRGGGQPKETGDDKS